MASSFRSPSEEDLLAEAEVVIQGAVRHRLRVSLRPSDYHERNLDALDLVGDIRLRLMQKLRALAQGETSGEINNFRDYAAQVTYNRIADYLRSKYPERTSLRNCLRRLLDKSDGYAVWPSDSGELMCGYVGWQFSTPKARVEAIQALKHDASGLPRQVLPGSSRGEMSAEQWRQLVEGIFDHLGGPLELDDLVAIVSPLVGVADIPESARDDDPDEAGAEAIPSSGPSPYSAWLTCERLKLFWAAFLRLLPWHRVSYFLNIREWDPMCLPMYGIATVEEIGRALELKPEQYQLLAQELGLTSAPPGTGADGGAHFVRFWNHLPLDDNLIAKVLGVSRAQVIGYRDKAKGRLARSLRASL